MDSLFAKYTKERTDDLVKENAFGFVVYKYLEDGKSVYIKDIYVIPELRLNGEASRFADEVVKEAKANGCTTLYGSVVPSAKYSTISLKVLLGYKMTLHCASNDFIVFRKDISNG